MIDKENNLLTCVGFIMDGNRRWAKEQGIDTAEGHWEGARTFERVVSWVREEQISHAVFYAFSTENWNRTPAEVQVLMSIFLETLQKRENVRVRVIGDRTRFSKELQEAIRETENATSAISGTTIWIAMSYGGRAEIIDGINKVIEQRQTVTEDSFGDYLWSAEMPDPDLIIRTGGDMRLSNFLPWQSVYSELFFTHTFWPAFTKEEFMRILQEYEKRQRRYGR